ncbi:UNVERIFIED_CONTAM: hypothetical protein Sradi_2111200 [Sesamum radiatum]|uniref:Uncharacterized protein n=1 Tax=Sesamum radiatum TaxID=300843 RepID=A0AAW2TJV3_SESRA
MLLDYHRQFFPPDHPYCRNKKTVTKNRVERKVAHPRLTGEQIRHWVEESSPAVEVLLSLPDGYGREHNWTKKAFFGSLSTGQNLIRYSLDVMHMRRTCFDRLLKLSKLITDRTTVAIVELGRISRELRINFSLK